MKPHAIFRGDTKGKTETNAKQEGDGSSVVIPANITGNSQPCPYSNEYENRGYQRTGNTGNDDIMPKIGNIVWKSGCHVSRFWSRETTQGTGCIISPDSLAKSPPQRLLMFK